MIIKHEYMSDCGKTYVQVDDAAGAVTELAFDHNPTDAEVQAAMDALAAEAETATIQLVAEDGTAL